MHNQINFYLDDFSKEINSAQDELVRENIVNRIWNKDFTIWKPDPAEISNRLGWLDTPDEMLTKVQEINSFVEDIKQSGFKKIVLLGMGGSSLAPEVFRFSFGIKPDYLDLSVLDTTDPVTISDISDNLDYSTTLFIVSTKSGGTVETLSLMKFFFNQTIRNLKNGTAGDHFIAITDPGSKLVTIAEQFNFRKTFINNPNIGGRFSALSFFGLVPAALVGVNIEEILSKAKIAADYSGSPLNKIALSGVVLGELANNYIDKITFLTSPPLKYFQAWVEQLIAESTGKNGKGILPVVNEPVLDVNYYSHDRVFVALKYLNDTSLDKVINNLRGKGFPVLVFELENEYDLGKQFFAWEFATAVAGWRLGIQPFDQPNVESAKVAARTTIQKYSEEGKLPEPEPDFVSGQKIKLFGNVKGNNLSGIFDNFFEQNIKNSPGSYAAIQAFITPSQENYELLQKIRFEITRKYKLASTVGFGPRFLHSTGQLHKGDAGNGIFLQFYYEPSVNLSIPEEMKSMESTITFDVLIKAQALGDRQALLDAGRKVLSINLSENPGEKLEYILSLFK